MPASVRLDSPHPQFWSSVLSNGALVGLHRVRRQRIVLGGCHPSVCGQLLEGSFVVAELPRKSLPTPEKARECLLLEGNLEQWIRCCTARFLRVARRVAGDDARAHDVLHESWIIVLEKPRQYRGGPPACGGVRAVVRHEALHGTHARAKEGAARRGGRYLSGLARGRRLPRRAAAPAAGGYRRAAPPPSARWCSCGTSRITRTPRSPSGCTSRSRMPRLGSTGRTDCCAPC